MAGKRLSTRAIRDLRDVVRRGAPDIRRKYKPELRRRVRPAPSGVTIELAVVKSHFSDAGGIKTICAILMINPDYPLGDLIESPEEDWVEARKFMYYAGVSAAQYISDRPRLDPGAIVPIAQCGPRRQWYIMFPIYGTC
jgi:hypothetical protein